MDNSAISIHSLRVEGDTMRSSARGIKSISIHSLRVEGDWQPPGYDTLTAAISIHSLRVEGDPRKTMDNFVYYNFNPLPPCGGRRCSLYRSIQSANFNPLPPCGGRPGAIRLRTGGRNFNPLPPCGGRPMECGISSFPMHFNPLPPCGGRLIYTKSQGTFLRFQSTPSVWRETASNPKVSLQYRNFNPLPPCGGRPVTRVARSVIVRISIHSLRVEGDQYLQQL